MGVEKLAERLNEVRNVSCLNIKCALVARKEKKSKCTFCTLSLEAGTFDILTLYSMRQT